MEQRTLSIIVAVASDGTIGGNGALLWRLPADLKRFKALTTGHSIVMGRKTFESLPCGALPNRQNIVITRNLDFAAENVTVAHSLDEALAKAEMPGEVFVIGGAQVYAMALAQADCIELTRVHGTFPQADTLFPPIDASQWEETAVEHHPADERNPYPYSFITLRRLK